MIIVVYLCIPVPIGSQEVHVSEPHSPAQVLVPAAVSPPPAGQSEPQPTTTGVYIKLFVSLYLDNP